MTTFSNYSREDLFKDTDGWHFAANIRGTNEEILAEARILLDKVGYKNVPLPETPERLWMDYLNPKSFSNGMYVFHPIIITASAYHEDAIVLSIYNENHPQHVDLWKGILISED